MAEIRHCKGCGCELSEDAKGNYCINCKGKIKEKVGKAAAVAVAGIFVVSAGLVKAIFKKGH